MRLLVPAVAVVLASASAFAQDEAEKPAVPEGASEAAASDGATGAVGGTSGDDFQRVEERAPRPGTPLITNKLYPMQYRFEFTGFFDISYADKYTEHIGGHGAVGFHLFDWLALEGYGGYLVGDETGIVKNVRIDGKSADTDCGGVVCEPQLPDMYQTTWFAGADVQFSPIYGKISAVSEYDLNFQLYLRLGGGAEGIQRRLNDLSYGDATVRATGSYGLGVRLIPWKYIAIRAELTNYIGLNPNVVEHDATDEANCPEGYILSNGNEDSCLTDFSQNAMFQVGVSFLL